MRPIRARPRSCRATPSLSLPPGPTRQLHPLSLSRDRPLFGAWAPLVSSFSLTCDRHRRNRRRPSPALSPRYYSLTSKVWRLSSPRTVTE
jgi:hypothetical protein